MFVILINSGNRQVICTFSSKKLAVEYLKKHRWHREEYSLSGLPLDANLWLKEKADKVNTYAARIHKLTLPK